MAVQPVRVPPALQLVRLKGQVLVPLPTFLLCLVLALLLSHGIARSGQRRGGSALQQGDQGRQRAHQQGVGGSWLNRSNDSWPVSRRAVQQCQHNNAQVRPLNPRSASHFGDTIPVMQDAALRQRRLAARLCAAPREDAAQGDRPPLHCRTRRERWGLQGLPSPNWWQQLQLVPTFCVWCGSSSKSANLRAAKEWPHFATGLADSLVGAVTLFWVAVLQRRAFFMTFGDSRGRYEWAFDQPNINWTWWVSCVAAGSAHFTPMLLLLSVSLLHAASDHGGVRAEAVHQACIGGYQSRVSFCKP
jgi:hypothetical protein